MVRRRGVVASLGMTIVGLAGCSGSSSPTPEALRYSVPALADGTVPPRLTCDGEGVSPRVDVSAVPEPTESIALTFTFPNDVASQVTLWTMWNIPPDTETIPAGIPATARIDSLDTAVQGRNGRGDTGYVPACPPPGRPYDHWFTLYACRRSLDVDPEAPRDDLEEALETATLASKRLVATYERSANTSSS